MTKLQVLHAYFTERLMEAVHEIMKVVGDTLSEYVEETDRTKRENENLRRKLREVGYCIETGFAKCSEPGASPLSVNRAVTEQQELSCTLRQDIQPTVTAVKVEFTAQHSVRRGEEELTGPETTSPGPAFPSPCAKRECEQDSVNQEIFPPQCETRDCIQDFLSHPELVLNTEVRQLPNVMMYQVKKETDEMDDSVSEKPTEPESNNMLNSGSKTVQNKNDECFNGEISESYSLTEQVQLQSKEIPNVLQEENSQSCVYCGRVFYHVSRLKIHERMHTRERSFQCTVCGKFFSQSGHLTVHQRTHTGKKPYCCKVCGKCFNYSGKFKEHQRIHTGERPYHCTFCGKSFSQSGHMKVHMRTHTGEKPYRCPECGNCFSRLSQLKRHLLTHSPDVPFGNHGCL